MHLWKETRALTIWGRDLHNWIKWFLCSYPSMQMQYNSPDVFHWLFPVYLELSRYVLERRETFDGCEKRDYGLLWRKYSCVRHWLLCSGQKLRWLMPDRQALLFPYCLNPDSPLCSYENPVITGKSGSSYCPFMPRFQGGKWADFWDVRSPQKDFGCCTLYPYERTQRNNMSIFSDLTLSCLSGEESESCACCLLITQE